nr:MAG TPA: hypothetical protein [Caudoviricetes sp.]
MGPRTTVFKEKCGYTGVYILSRFVECNQEGVGMAYKQLGLVDLISAIQRKVEEQTDIKCHDTVPLNAKSPFYYAEVVGKRPAHTKTMWRDVFTVWIHVIAEPGESSVQIYKLIQKLEEALTEDIVLPEEFELIMQTNNGIQTIKKDETKEKHAVLAYEFMVCYGFKCKI